MKGLWQRTMSVTSEVRHGCYGVHNITPRQCSYENSGKGHRVVWGKEQNLVFLRIAVQVWTWLTRLCSFPKRAIPLSPEVQKGVAFVAAQASAEGSPSRPPPHTHTHTRFLSRRLCHLRRCVVSCWKFTR